MRRDQPEQCQRSNGNQQQSDGAKAVHRGDGEKGAQILLRKVDAQNNHGKRCIQGADSVKHALYCRRQMGAETGQEQKQSDQGAD